MKVAFLHPDLGIGGAERLVVDCALAMQQLNHQVTIYTSHHDPSHAFDETTDGTLDVKVRGNSIFPRNLAGKLSILMAIMRQMHLVASLVGDKAAADTDIFFVDQLSAAVPYLRASFPKARIIFYCHHPDLVLTPRGSVLKKAYRVPFDMFEKWSTAKSDVIAVNSEYTRQVFFNTFGRIGMPDPYIVYPIVDPHVTPPVMDSLDISEAMRPFVSGEARYALSINRFERKKDIDLVISAFSLMMHAHPDQRQHALVLAGGYDERVRENIEYLQELQKLCKKFRIPYATKFPADSLADLDWDKTRVLFLPSVSSSTKHFLLQNAALLAYTPTNEHFGIVPLEAMCAETPVLATNTGGPLETIKDGETGWLRKPDMEDWYRVLYRALVVLRPEDLREMGRAGRQRVISHFSLKTLQTELANLVRRTEETERKNEAAVRTNTVLVSVLIVVLVIVGGLGAAVLVYGMLCALPVLRASLEW